MKVNLNRNLLDFRGREFVELVNGKESKKSLDVYKRQIITTIPHINLKVVMQLHHISIQQQILQTILHLSLIHILKEVFWL